MSKMSETRKSVSVDNIVGLLSIADKNKAICMFEAMIPNINFSTNEDVAEKIFKILPAFLAHLYLNNEKEKLKAIILSLMNKEGLGFRLYLLTKWQIFVSSGEEIKCHSNISLEKCMGYDDLKLFIELCRFLKTRKLHKYIYFFANLTLAELIMMVEDQTAIYGLEKKVNLHPITNGGRGAIIRMVDDLKYITEKRTSSRTNSERRQEIQMFEEPQIQANYVRMVKYLEKLISDD